MKIVHLIPYLSGGGAERQLDYLSRQQAHKGHDVHILYLNEGPLPHSHSVVKYHKISTLSNYNPKILWQILIKVKQIQPDIIQTWAVQMDILGGFVAIVSNIPWIIREPNQELAYRYNRKRKLRIIMAVFVNAVISNSIGGDQYWRKYIPERKRFIIQNGLQSFDINRTIKDIPFSLINNDLPIVLYVGRLTKHKNVELLIEAMALVQKKIKINGLICGDGILKNGIKSICKQLNMDSFVSVLGYTPNNIILQIMKKASVFVSLSKYEGCPNTVMEAMACKCPVIVSDIAAHKEILDDNSAFFVSTENVSMVADSIIQALSEKQKANFHVKNAYKKSLNWSIEKMTNRYLNVYHSVLNLTL